MPEIHVGNDGKLYRHVEETYGMGQRRWVWKEVDKNGKVVTSAVEGWLGILFLLFILGYWLFH
jgi:hypothetical protein